MSRLTAPAKLPPQAAAKPPQPGRPPFPASAPASLLASAASLQAELDGVDLAIQHKLTTVAQAGVQKPAGVPASVFEAGKLAKPERRPRIPTPLLVVAGLAIERGIPITAMRNAPVDQPYRDLLAAMQVGDSVKITNSQARALRHVAVRLHKKIVVRDQGDGFARVWLPASSGDAA